ncbi:hypothetical protein FRB95_002501 [Tulasnella sp. JGI-2019a]|nr:hypothetical protein FRB95_002501 [Tulasnella sp. JGI-2019a]
MGDALDAAKLGLTALSIGLQASLIPEPFKSAVSGIPGAVLQIIEIVETVKGNVDDARDLALYIGQVTETAADLCKACHQAFLTDQWKKHSRIFAGHSNSFRKRSVLFCLAVVPHVSCIIVVMLRR